ncbi:MAG TPA: DMT family transporter [Steroidobacteraceae bacterium]
MRALRRRLLSSAIHSSRATEITCGVFIPPKIPSKQVSRVTWRAWITFVVLCVVWGVPYFFIKLALADLSPVWIAFTRITLAAAVLLPIACKRGALDKVFEHKGAIVAFAIIELVAPFVLIGTGEQWISSSLAGILVATVPMLVLLLAPLFGLSERLGPARLLGLFIGFLGVLTLSGVDPNQGPMLWAGVACVMVASIGYAIGPLLVQKHLADVDETGAVAASLVVAAVLLAPLAAFSIPARMPSMLSIVSVVVLGTLCTAAGLVLYLYLITEAGAARAAVVAYVCPGVAALAGVWVLDEPFGFGAAVGMLMILVGSWLATRKSQEPVQVSPHPVPPPQAGEGM